MSKVDPLTTAATIKCQSHSYLRATMEGCIKSAYWVKIMLRDGTRYAVSLVDAKVNYVALTVRQPLGSHALSKDYDPFIGDIKLADILRIEIP